MTIDIIFFAVSIVISTIIVYILTLLWYSNEHSRQLISFIGFGVSACLWILFSAITSITGSDYFIFMYTLHGVTGIVFPYAFLWYVLNLSKSRLANSKVVACIVFGLPLLDSIMLITNPWHRLMFLTYDYPDMPTGQLFWLHAIIAYIALLFALIKIFIYVLGHVRRTPLMVIAALSTLLPVVINVLLALDMLGTRRDLTPVSFFITFTLFFLASYRTGVFTFKAIAMDSIFMSLSDATIITNLRGKIVDANSSFLKMFIEYPIVLGETSIHEFSSWLSERSIDCNPENLLETISDHENYHNGGEFSVKLKDNAVEQGDYEITLALQRDVIRNGNNGKSGYVITMTDVSTYKSMINEINTQNEDLIALTKLAEEASKTKSAFLANMSHEIRTPINAITGMAAIAKISTDPEKIDNCLNNIEAASKQLLGLINNVLDMSKIEAEKMSLADEPFDLHEIIENTINIIGIRAKEKNQDLIVETAENLPRVLVGDDMKLTQILINLLSNAIKFTPPEGAIHLKSELLDTKDGIHRIEFKVIDNGIGVSPEQQGRLFNTFEQAETSTSKNFGGSGLGLALSKSIAELMGGTITLESELGEGSCFTVTLLIKSGDESMLRKPEDEKEYDFTGKRVLLAEDIEINRQIVVELMEMNNVQVTSASDGQETVDIFLASPDEFDIIFMDIHMPVLDGYEATKIIRSSDAPNAKDIPILAMTANAFAEDVSRCIAVGMNGHVAKPIEIDILLQKMCQLLL